MEILDIDIADFAAYARSKPAGETYNYMSNDDCALAQYLRDRRPDVPVRPCGAVGGFDVAMTGGESMAIPTPLIGVLDQKADEDHIRSLEWSVLADALEAIVAKEAA